MESKFWLRPSSAKPAHPRDARLLVMEMKLIYSELIIITINYEHQRRFVKPGYFRGYQASSQIPYPGCVSVQAAEASSAKLGLDLSAREDQVANFDIRLVNQKSDICSCSR